MKEATFPLALLAAVVAIRFVWFRLTARSVAARSAVAAMKASVFSRAPLPRLNAAEAALNEPDLPLWTGQLPVSGDCLIPFGADALPGRHPLPHRSLRGTLLRIASVLYPHATTGKRLRRTPLPGNEAGECLFSRVCLMSCPA